MKYYCLNEDKTYRECTFQEWKSLFKSTIKHVGDDSINDKSISTIFMGINHNHGIGSPLLFETMIFDNNENRSIYMERYSTWGDAEEGHCNAIQWVLDRFNLNEVD